VPDESQRGDGEGDDEHEHGYGWAGGLGAIHFENVVREERSAAVRINEFDDRWAEVL
jgi:hypothetical protein